MTIVEKTLDKLESILEKGNLNFDYGFDIVNKNYFTGRNYLGLFNNITLSIAKDSLGYKFPYWIGFGQASKMYIPVRTGEHGIPIMCKQYKKRYYDGNGYEIEVEKGDSVDGLQYEENSYWTNVYVFNIEQTSIDIESVNQFDFNEDFTGIDNLLVKYMGREKIALSESFDYCKYNKIKDVISMVSKDSFYSKSAYYGSFAHECIHSTGHENRLNRKLVPKSLDPNGYANEELIAELGSMLILSEFEISSRESSSGAYIKSWMHDKSIKELYDFCTIAQKAVNFMKEGNK